MDEETESGLIYSEAEWEEEWTNLLKLASAQPRSTNTANSTNGNGKSNGDSAQDSDDESDVFYESLEELHVFVLAHVLCRPIIIVADTILKDSNGDALAPISFGGVYLPLECSPSECYNTPLLLTYDAAHFSAIVPIEDSSVEAKLSSTSPIAAIPLVDSDYNLLPIHFMIDPGATGDSLTAESRLTESALTESSLTESSDPEKTNNSVDSVSAINPLSLLEQYLDVEYIAVPEATNVAAEDLTGSSLPVHAASCNELSRVASLESEDPLINLKSDDALSKRGNSLKTDVKAVIKEEDLPEENGSSSVGSSSEKKNKNKMPKSMQNISRSFGSLGRSFRKKLSKTALGRSGKKKVSVDEPGVSVSTSESLNIIDSKDNSRRKIPCAKLLHRRYGYQETMVRNYLTTAFGRYERERAEMNTSGGSGNGDNTSRVNQTESSVTSIVDDIGEVQCINTGCDGMGSAATSYLCGECFERQRKDEMELKNSLSDYYNSAANSGVTSCSTNTTSVESHSGNNAGSAGDLQRVDSGPYLPRQIAPTTSRPSSGSGYRVINVTSARGGAESSQADQSRASARVAQARVAPSDYAGLSYDSTRSDYGGAAYRHGSTTVSSNQRAGTSVYAQDGNQSAAQRTGQFVGNVPDKLTLYRDRPASAVGYSTASGTSMQHGGILTSSDIVNDMRSLRSTSAGLATRTTAGYAVCDAQGARRFERDLEERLSEMQEMVVSKPVNNPGRGNIRHN